MNILKTSLIAAGLFFASGCDSGARIQQLSTALSEPIKPATASGSTARDLADFQVEHCTLTYRDRPLTFGVSIDQWVKVLGPFDHWHDLANDLYLWDDLGIKLYSATNAYTADSLSFVFDNRLAYDAVDIAAAEARGSDELMRKINAAKPKSKFDSVVWINGALIGEQWDLGKAQAQMRQYNPKATSSFAEGYLPTIFVSHSRCQPGKYPDYKNRQMIFRLDTQPNDLTKTRVLTIGIDLK